MKYAITILSLALALALSSQALAASSPSGDAYGGQGNVAAGTQSGTAKPTSAKPGEGLPFTGSDLALIVAGAVVLIGVGGTLRYRMRTHE